MAAIVSAYNDGRAVVSKIRERRRIKQAPPPSQLLDTSLGEAAHDIDNEKTRGVTRLGPKFATGDDVAVTQLHQIRIELQAELFEQLAQALQDDNMTDFRPALHASDLGRDHTVTALIQLRQRLMIALPIERTLQDSSPQIMANSSIPRQRQISVPALNFYQSSRIPRSVMGKTGSEVVPERARRRESSSPKSISYFPSYPKLFRRKRSEDCGGVVVAQAGQRLASIDGPAGQDCSSHSNETVASTPGTTPETRNEWMYIDEENTTNVWGAPEAPSRTPAAWQGLYQSPPITIPHRSSLTLPTPSADNDYLGFCKGAWKLQCGAPDALKKKIEFHPGWSGSEVPYLACGSSRCVFAYRLPPDQLDKIWHSSKGVSFRWRFLAKSHVVQGRVSNERYEYRCLFCALTGEKTTIWQGVDTLLEHLSRHRGQVLPPEVLHRTLCISDRVAGDDEAGWDVNLRPLGKEIVRPSQDSLFEELVNPWQ